MVDKNEINVVVTGGTPDIHLGYDFNTSGMIRDALPSQIVRQNKPTINIVKYPQGIPCIYPWVIDMAKKLASGDRAVFDGNVPADVEPFQPDLIIHMGMTGRETGYIFETLARRDGYSQPGQDGISFPTEILEKGGDWADMPEVLHTEFDMNDAKEKVLRQLPDLDLKVSDRAGLYFCEFELWATLAELRLRQLPGKAVFFHVPQARTGKAIEMGAKVVEELISALFDG